MSNVLPVSRDWQVFINAIGDVLPDEPLLVVDLLNLEAIERKPMVGRWRVTDPAGGITSEEVWHTRPPGIQHRSPTKGARTGSLAHRQRRQDDPGRLCTRRASRTRMEPAKLRC